MGFIVGLIIGVTLGYFGKDKINEMVKKIKDKM